MNLFSAIIVVYLSISLSAFCSLYWTDAATGKIQQSDPAGGEITDIVTGLGSPSGVVVSSVDGKIYWTDRSTSVIQRCDADGTNIENLVTKGLSDAFGLALDEENGKLYWADAYTGKIQRANLDGSNVEDIVTGLTGAPESIALDPKANVICWTNFVSGTVQYSDLNGDYVSTVYSGFTGLEGVFLAPTIGKMYFCARGEGAIYEANLDGSGYQKIIQSLSQPIGITADVDAGKLYWVEDGSGKLLSANLDGTGVSILQQLVYPKGIALVQASAPPSSATVSFESSTFITGEGESSNYPTVLLTGNIADSVFVDLVFVGNENILEADVSYGLGVSFNPNFRNQESFYLYVRNNEVIDPDRTFKLKLVSSDPNVTVAEPSELTVIITDDDVPGTVYFDTSSTVLHEGEGVQSVTLRRFENDPGPLTARVLSQDETALAARDYLAVDTLVHFPDGIYEQKVNIQPYENTPEKKPARDFLLELSAPTSATKIGIPATVNVTLNDKDDPGSTVTRFSLPAQEGGADLLDVVDVAFAPDGALFALVNYSFGSSNFSWKLVQFSADGEGVILATLPSGGFMSDIDIDRHGMIYLAGPNLYRYFPDGTRDMGFVNSFANYRNNLQKVLTLPDGKLLAAGTIEGDIGGYSRNQIVRLNNDGTVDPSFNAGEINTTRSTWVYDLALEPSGKILIAGQISMIQGNAQYGAARLWPDGTLDTSFDSSQAVQSLGSNSASQITVSTEGQIYLGVSGSRGGIIRLNSDGLRDTSFTLVDGGRFALQPDGKMVTNTYESYQNDIERFLDDGSLDADFDCYNRGSGSFETPVIGPDGQIYVFGRFNSADGFTVPCIASLKAGDGGRPGKLSWVKESVTTGESAGSVWLKVQRQDSFDAKLGVFYTVIPKTADDGTDVIAATMGYQFFGEHESEVAIPISLIDDNVEESLESFDVVLSNSVGGALISQQDEMEVTIVDDDGNDFRAWYARHYPTAPESGNVATDDSDGDGVPVIVEWMTNSNPLSVTDVKRPVVGLVEIEGEGSTAGALAISFYYDKTKTDFSVVVETSKALTSDSWVTIWESSVDPNLESENIVSSLAGSSGWLTVSDLNAIEQCGFVRVKYSNIE